MESLAVDSRIKSLDGLRALSIGMVLLAHVSMTTEFPQALKAALFTFGSGDLGVNIFFVISGFLITRLLLTEEQNHGALSLRNFYIKRFFRIIPVYFFFLGVVYLLKETGWMKDVLANSFLPPLTFTTGTLPIDTGWTLSHTWSLSIEEQFYLIWPLLVLIFKSKKQRNGILLAFIFLIPIARGIHYKLYDTHDYTFFLRADCIMMGCWLAINERQIKSFAMNRNVKVVFFTFIVFSVALLNWLSYKSTLGIVTVPFMFTLHGLLGATAIYWFSLLPSRETWGFRVLNYTPVVYVGKLSYSLYIWQQLFLQDSKTIVHAWKMFPFNILLIFPVAMFSYHLVEQPFLKWRKFVLKES